MIVGIVSDSHDHQERTKAAVELFNSRGVGYVIHAGDIISPFTMFHLNSLSCDWIAVLGNNDGERSGLSIFSEGRVVEPPHLLALDGKRIVVVHDLAAIDMEQLVQSTDVVVHGHTHHMESRMEGGVLFVNPGECCGYLTGAATVALLDTASMKVQFVEIS